MTNYYLDTSALIKRYVAEVGSRWLINLVNGVSTPLLIYLSSDGGRGS